MGLFGVLSMSITIPENHYDACLKAKSEKAKRVIEIVAGPGASSIEGGRGLWDIPQEVFRALDEEFKFTVKLYILDKDIQCQEDCSTEEELFKRDWQGEAVFLNPSGSKNLETWINKCHEESRKPNTAVVAVIPLVYRFSHFYGRVYEKARHIRFVKGKPSDGSGANAALFQSIVAVF